MWTDILEMCAKATIGTPSASIFFKSAPLRFGGEGKSARMEVRLSVTNGKANVKQVVLGPETIIGRSQECNLKIASSQVSRRHSRITVSDTEVRVSDLGSANGTFLNGRALPPETEVVVAPGNALTIGPLRFVFQFTPPVPRKVAQPVLPESDTKDAIPLSLMGRAASQLGEEETVDSTQRAAQVPSPLGPSPLGSARTPIQSTHDLDTDFEEGLPDRTLTGLKNEPVVVSPPEGAADTVLDMNLEEEARRKAAQKAAEGQSVPAGSDEESDVPESNTDSGTALLLPGEGPESAETGDAEFPDFKSMDEDEEEEPSEPGPKSRKDKDSGKKKWGLLGGMFGKGKTNRPASKRRADEDEAEVEEELELDAAPAPKASRKPQPVPVEEEDETEQIGPPVSFDDAEAPPEPAKKAGADEPEFDPADFLSSLSSKDAEENLDPKTKQPEDKSVVAKPAERRVAPRLTPEVKSAAKPSPPPEVKSNNSGDKSGGDPSLSDFLKNL